jgi:hypothetical protein
VKGVKKGRKMVMDKCMKYITSRLTAADFCAAVCQRNEEEKVVNTRMIFFELQRISYFLYINTGTFQPQLDDNSEYVAMR